MTGYVRTDTTNNIADGNVISAADLDNEFNGVQAAFNSSTGHTHDGSSAEGAPITKLGPVQDVTVSTTVLGVKTTNTVDLGTSSLKFKDFYLAGNALIGGTLGVTGATTLSAALTYGGVTLSNAVTGTGSMVLSASPTITGTITAAAANFSGAVALNGNATIGDADTDTITQAASYVTGTQLKSAKTATNTLSLAAYDVDGTAYTNLITLTAGNTPTLALTSTGVGTINNMSIGATTASTGAFTTLSATGTITSTAVGTILTRSGASTSQQVLQLANTSGNALLGVESSTGASLLTGGTAYATFLSSFTATPVQIGVNGAVVSTFSSTGLAVTGTLSTTGAITTTGGANVQTSWTLAEAGTRSLVLKNPTSTLNASVGTGTNHDLVVEGNTVYVNTGSFGARSTIGTFSTTGLAVTGTFSSTLGATIQGLTVGLGGGAVSTNTAVGVGAIAATATGTYATAIGYAALTALTSGLYNTAVGGNALVANQGGSSNSALGVSALGANVSGNQNTGIGADALRFTTGSNNTAVGYQAGFTNQTGTRSVLVGATAGRVATALDGDVHIGYAAGFTQNTGFANTLVGGRGSVSLNNGAGFSLTSGTYNTFIGGSAGSVVDIGSKNTILGNYTGNSGGLDIRAASNYIVLSDGDGNPRAYWTNNAYLHINNTNNRNGTSIYYASNDVLNIHSDQAAGNATSLIAGWYSATSTTTGNLALNITTNGNITNLNNSYGGISDAKLKENIVDATPKLDKLMQVRVRNYNLKGNCEQHKQIGVIAQELEAVFPAMVEETLDKDIDGDDLGTTTKSVKYSVFVPILIKAIQELKAEVDSLKSQLNGASA